MRHQPVNGVEADRLGRANFAKLLGQALTRFSSSESYVVALYGKFGSGKTSVINMCLESIAEADPPSGAERSEHEHTKPVVFRFEPFMYSTTGQLYVRFFSQLAAKLEEEGGQFKGVGALLTSLGGYAQSAGKVLDAVTGSPGVFTGVGTAVQKTAETYSQGREAQQNNPEELKNNISKKLRESGRRIIIVVDDIDRLTSEEIRDVFRLVKAVADFPNTIYLLAFDFDLAAKALDSVQGTGGAKYMEKIVQAPFMLPDVGSGQLLSLLHAGVEEIAKNTDGVRARDIETLDEDLDYLGHLGFDELIGSARQVNRLLDAFEFTLPAVAGEVRLKDFVVLEGLRICQPKVYDLLVAKRSFFLGVGGALFVKLSGHFGDAQKMRELIHPEADRIAKACDSEEQRAVVLELLKFLFPLYEGVMRGMGSFQGDFITQWQNERRVCAPDVFRTATGWALPSGVVPAGEVEELLAMDDPDELRTRLLTYRTDDRFELNVMDVVLRRVTSGFIARHDADETSLDTLIKALISINEPGEDYRTLHFHLRDLLTQYKLHSDSDASAALMSSLMDDYGLTPPYAVELHDIHKRRQPSYQPTQSEELHILSAKDLAGLLDKAVTNIKVQAEDSTLLEKDIFDIYLYLWKDKGVEEPKDYIRRLLSSPASLVAFIKAYLARSTLAYSNAVVVEIQGQDQSALRLALLKDFDLLKEATDAVGELLGADSSPISPDDRTLVEALERYLRYEQERSNP